METVRYEFCTGDALRRKEQELCDLCTHYFGTSPPYQRVLTEDFLTETKKEIRNGAVYLAVGINDELCGFCVVCSPTLDARVASFATAHNSDLYLAALIVKEDYRRAGHAQKLLMRAIEHQQTNRMILITPRRNIPSVRLYESIGFQTIADFEQTEIHSETGESFNLHRIVMAGTVFPEKNTREVI